MKTTTCILTLFVALLSAGCSSSTEEPTEPKILSEPSELSSSRFAVNAVQLMWKDNSNSEDSFAIERRRGSAKFTQVLFVPSDVTVAIDSIGLTPDSTYTYRVRALRFIETSPFSNTTSIDLSLPFP
ncbi:MAG: hypothetical protein A2X67_06895 [Ignavibacteria bacterium GWA2_55_11]|nr:MAG: hypothetical protein A2X67_06895 [Ignavibacteria bacterium GWA2_55_11]OGU44875.1 MAG: hypothetical protein A2X68_10120 [Ignavibacteria bacterium GWC2_56_12]OGU63289.1 MAG: hypothetical protein A3C56_10420 [Ignavibacteria bacterium RIFCSPHIGHO2_02_FULL_56_12]OGU72128.1 MAG: hypothetical protein A3G43_05800 [Ignavibacteria bacterium RIFCSPLOWO2_12_FULL_56_21]OGU74195.1 MAG: hypothetical protein A3H45_03865 [Ignavibacteria bacterium RIFCSPLOWO2_02_FULL_55_14]HAV22972.1 hypothetical protei